MTTTGDTPDLARAEALAAWLREQPMPKRARNALLRDLGRVADDSAGNGRSALRGLDRDGFVAELYASGGGAIAAVAEIGAKSLAALRRAIPPQTPRNGCDAAGGPSLATKAGNAAPALATPSPEPSSAPAIAGGTPPAAGLLGGAEGAEGGAEQTLAELTAAAEGLLMPSESDYPFAPFRWEGADQLTPAALLAQLGLPPETFVETRSLERFFAPLVQTADWMDDHERARAARFAQLHDRIATTLSETTVYRVGQIEVTVVIAGQDAAGNVVGLRTTVIET